jgi:HSP20 family molecular chaperone IbpA
VLQLELEIGPFERHLQLPEEVDVERATATYEHGLLTIVLPVAVHPPRAVTVPIEVTAP